MQLKRRLKKFPQKNHGEKRINYRLRDAVFGRQRYWGEPIPVYYKDDIPYPLNESELPLVLPEIDKFLPTEDRRTPIRQELKTGNTKTFTIMNIPLCPDGPVRPGIF